MIWRLANLVKPLGKTSISFKIKRTHEQDEVVDIYFAFFQSGFEDRQEGVPKEKKHQVISGFSFHDKDLIPTRYGG